MNSSRPVHCDPRMVPLVHTYKARTTLGLFGVVGPFDEDRFRAVRRCLDSGVWPQFCLFGKKHQILLAVPGKKLCSVCVCVCRRSCTPTHTRREDWALPIRNFWISSGGPLWISSKRCGLLSISRIVRECVSSCGRLTLRLVAECLDILQTVVPAVHQPFVAVANKFRFALLLWPCLMEIPANA